MIHAHLVSILAATVAAFMVGGLWYGPLFGKAWMAECGFTQADKGRVNMGKLFGTTLAMELVSAFFLGHLLGHVAHSAQTTMMISIGIALGFIVPMIVVDYSYAMKSWRLTAIDCGHWLAVYAAMGAVFVALGV